MNMNYEITEKLSEALASSAPWLGAYSLNKHLAFCFLAYTIYIGLIFVAVKLRGQPRGLAIASARDAGLSALCALSVIFFPLAIFFLGRSIYRAFVPAWILQE